MRDGSFSFVKHGMLPENVAPVAVTPWTARLVDDDCERDYRLSRFADDRRRFQFVLAFIGLTTTLNLVGDFYAIRNSGIDLGWGLYPQVVLLIVTAVSLPMTFRVATPRSLEWLTILFALAGLATTLGSLSLHARLGAIWPTLMVGVIIIVYFCLPLRFTTMVVLAAGYTLLAPLTWSVWAGPVPSADDMYRIALRLMLANVLGFSVANTLQRSQRVQFAQNRLLQQLLSTDSLTGIANRRYFDHALADEWRRCARAGTPLSLLMIDVDYFKAYNDNLGHVEGDACLRRVAALLSEAGRRPGDLVARYGGEEFVCLLSDTDSVGAAFVAQRLMAALKTAAIAHPQSPLGPHLTMSIGAATARPPAETPDALVTLADRLLYLAKDEGRNRVISADLGGAPPRRLRAAPTAAA